MLFLVNLFNFFILKVLWQTRSS